MDGLSEPIFSIEGGVARTRPRSLYLLFIRALSKFHDDRCSQAFRGILIATRSISMNIEYCTMSDRNEFLT